MGRASTTVQLAIPREQAAVPPAATKDLPGDAQMQTLRSVCGKLIAKIASLAVLLIIAVASNQKSAAAAPSAACINATATSNGSTSSVDYTNNCGECVEFLPVHVAVGEGQTIVGSNLPTLRRGTNMLRLAAGQTQRVFFEWIEGTWQGRAQGVRSCGAGPATPRAPRPTAGSIQAPEPDDTGITSPLPPATPLNAPGFVTGYNPFGANFTARCWTNQEDCYGEGIFPGDRAPVRCLRIYFSRGGRAEFCVPSGQSWYVRVGPGDRACWHYINAPVPDPCPFPPAPIAVK